MPNTHFRKPLKNQPNFIQIIYHETHLFLVSKANFHAKIWISNVTCHHLFIACIKVSKKNVSLPLTFPRRRSVNMTRACARSHSFQCQRKWVGEQVKQNKLRANSKINQIVCYLSPSFHLSDERYCQSIWCRISIFIIHTHTRTQFD